MSTLHQLATKLLSQDGIYESNETTKLTPEGENTLSRLRGGSEWLTASHLAWVGGKPNAATDERVSTALAAWDELERDLRSAFGYEGCIFGPGERCPKDAPVSCDSCVEAKTNT